LTGKFQTGGSASAAYQSPAPQKRAPIAIKPQAKPVPILHAQSSNAVMAKQDEWTQF